MSRELVLLFIGLVLVLAAGTDMLVGGPGADSHQQ
jgi:hypothetical protein